MNKRRAFGKIDAHMEMRGGCLRTEKVMNENGSQMIYSRFAGLRNCERVRKSADGFAELEGWDGLNE